MDLITSCHLRTRLSFASASNGVCCRISRKAHYFSFPCWPCAFPHIPKKSHVLRAKKKRETQSILKPSIVEEVSMVDDDDEVSMVDDVMFLDDLEDEEFDDDGDYLEEETRVGDGSGGGGVCLAGTSWDRTALAIAEEVAQSFDGELGIYAFKTLLNGSIQVRVERLTNKSGSPSMMDIETFSSAYRARLDEAEVAESIPDNISLEVSSPGVERVVRIPQDIERFKDRAMFVKYVSEIAESGSASEHDGVFRLVSYDLERNSCTWGLANVRINREKAGKGRPLSKKQQEWRLETAFDSLRLVRLYSEI